ncbi:MAG TPA: GSCFA domain-containing protein [Chryseosolibacter sp.]
MNHFRTIVSIRPSSHKIGLKSGVFTIGSCFADAIGQRLSTSKFASLVNPFGTTYNPLSIHKNIFYALKNELPAGHTYLVRDDVHLNYDFHSSLSALEKSELTKRISNAIGTSHYFLKTANYMLITYGTAWIYSRKESGEMVNNCHKVAAGNFNKRLLSEQEIVGSFDSLYMMAKKYNPALRFILTLSPVRHIKDTLELNSVSKAVLRSACYAISTHFADAEYFPAYEIMMDDLRDYRFYKSDMLHPTEEAEDYIWKNFMSTYFDQEIIRFVEDWNALTASLQHKPFHVQSSSHQQFLKQTLKKLENISSRVNVDTEIAAVKAQLIA